MMFAPCVAGAVELVERQVKIVLFISLLSVWMTPTFQPTQSFPGVGTEQGGDRREENLNPFI